MSIVLNVLVSSDEYDAHIESKSYEIKLDVVCTDPPILVESEAQLTQWTAQVGEIETRAMPTYSICFEEVLSSDLNFSFYEGTEEIADAANWLAVDSDGNLIIAPSCTEFPHYVHQGTLVVKIVATPISNASIVNEEVTVSLEFPIGDMTECEPTWVVIDTTAWDTSLWRETS